MKSISTYYFAGLLALCFLILHRPAAAQAPQWQTAQAVATATAAVMYNHSAVTATAVDAAGNVYLAGTFTNTVTLGATTLTSLGDADVFVAKFNPASNQFVWAQRAGGTGLDQPNALAVTNGNVYVAGIFYSPTASFGATNLTLTGGYSNGFVAKLVDAGSTGSFVWAQQTSSTFTCLVAALAVSGSSVYVTGSYNGSTASFGNLTLPSSGGQDLFVAKLADAGSTSSFVWAQRGGGAGSVTSDQGNALAVSGNSVYVAGSFSGTAASFGNITLTSAGAYDVFVAKLADAGSTSSFVWAQRGGGANLDEARGVAVSGSSVYVAGTFHSPTASFGATTLTNAGAANTHDMFVAKLTDAGSTGSFGWVQQAGGTGSDELYALAATGSNVYVAGYFASTTISFGTTTLVNTSAGSSDVFVAKLTDAGSTGSFGWAQRAGGAGSDGAGSLVISSNNVYVAGAFVSSTASFGTIALTNPTPNRTLGFLASFTDATLTAAAPSRNLTAVQLYPNPARHATTLRRPAGPAPAPLTLCDALGRPVRRYPAPAAAETALDLRGLPAGLYLLRGAGPAQRLLVE